MAGRDVHSALDRPTAGQAHGEFNLSVAPERASLLTWGWNEHFEDLFRVQATEGLLPGRVVLEFNQFFRLQTPLGEILAEVAGRLKHEAASRAELPAVGDWVVIRPVASGQNATITALLSRQSRFTRKVKGTKTDEQVIAANVDTVFLVTSLNQDFNPRRLERYLSIARESGAAPVILLTKADLCPETPDRLAEIRTIAPDLPVHAISALHNRAECLSTVSPYLLSGRTIALIGSSGVGKSTLLNQLLGEDRQIVNRVRESDDRGLHTTRHRELIRLPNNCLIIDTPGMREIQLWETDDGVETTFEDIEQLARSCRFSDCQHLREPGCAVRASIENGELAAARLENYRKLRSELQQLAERRRDRRTPSRRSSRR